MPHEPKWPSFDSIDLSTVVLYEDHPGQKYRNHRWQLWRKKRFVTVLPPRADVEEQS